MLSNKQIEDMLYTLSSFYRDFLPVDNSMMKLVNIYAQTIDYVWNVYAEANDSRFVSTARTMSMVPYFKVDIDESLYDLNTARVLSRMTFDEQIAYMDKEGIYTPFTFYDKDNAGDPIVYSMRLFVNFTDKTPIKLYEEYFIRSNRLYLLPSYIQNRKKVVHYLHAFDIKINDFTLEKNFGTRFSLQPGPLLPRYEYRDVLEAYIRAFQGKMTIKSIRESIQLATKWESFDIEDYKSPSISPRKLELYTQWVISPFRFIVSLPESLIPDKIKINIVRTLLSEIKEAHTDYMIFFDIDRLDPYAMPMIAKPTIDYQRGETFIPEDESNVQMVKMKFLEDPMNFGNYDSSYYYNWNLQYDSGMAEHARVIYHSSPRIPRSFMAAKNPTTGDITFTTSSNVDETIEFELHASADGIEPYVLIETVVNDSAAPTISYQHNANGSGKLYYKSRAKDPNNISMFTLPIDVSKDFTPPNSVQGLRIDNVTEDSITVSWDANNESDIAGYEVVAIYESNPPNSVQGLRIDNVTEDSITVSWDANNESDIAGYEVVATEEE
jgi:hypothetical protein